MLVMRNVKKVIHRITLVSEIWKVSKGEPTLVKQDCSEQSCSTSVYLP